jgi:hypothetical protein
MTIDDAKRTVEDITAKTGKTPRAAPTSRADAMVPSGRVCSSAGGPLAPKAEIR